MDLEKEGYSVINHLTIPNQETASALNMKIGEYIMFYRPFMSNQLSAFYSRPDCKELIAKYNLKPEIIDKVSRDAKDFKSA